MGQKESETSQQAWLGYFNQTRLTPKSGLWLDLQFRTNSWVDEAASSIVRLGYTYYARDQLRLTAGYGWITHFALSPHAPDIPEHRAWQQVQWFDKNYRASLAQYLRVEQRFVRKEVDGKLLDDHRFTWRFRYNFAVSIPIRAAEILPKTPFLFLNDEIHVNAGRNIVNNYFDQNRLFAGLGYQFSRDVNAHLGYLYVFQQLPTGNRYVHVHALRLFVFHKLDLGKN